MRAMHRSVLFLPVLGMAGFVMAGFATPSLAQPSTATLPTPSEPSLVGIWYSAFQPDEPDVLSLIEFKADGTFYEEFRKCMDGDFIGYQTQSGTWSVDGKTEHTVTNRLNGRRAMIEDAYVIEALTDMEHRVRLDPQGHIFVGYRVENFEFPDCPSGT